MKTVKDILDYLNAIAPPALKAEWDNIGLTCGNENQPVSRILVALDPFPGVLEEAAETGADLVVTHHPLIFSPVSSVTDNDTVGQSIRFCIENGISTLNAHTNLDCADGGVNDVLAGILQLRQVKSLPCDGLPGDLLRVGTAEPQTLTDYLRFIRDTLSCPGLRYTDSGKQVHKVAVGGGACAGELYAVKKAGCDTFVTSDVKYNQFWDAKEMGINLIDAGHFYTENPICAVLREKLAGAFPEIPVEISKSHRDIMKFFP